MTVFRISEKLNVVYRPTPVSGRYEPLFDSVDVVRLQDLTQQVHHLKHARLVVKVPSTNSYQPITAATT